MSLSVRCCRFWWGLYWGIWIRNCESFSAVRCRRSFLFFAFALGNTIDLSVIGQTGFLGVMLGVAVIIITGIPLMVADKLLGGGDGTAGIAASSSAGAAVATPVLIAEMVPAFKPVAPAATTLVATSVIVTSVLVPIITAMWSKHVKGGDGTAAPEEGTPEQEQSQQAAHH
ncbi:2-keto-3-deoxygluconate permease [Dickeya oryzae]